MNRSMQCVAALALCGIGFAAGRTTLMNHDADRSDAAHQTTLLTSTFQPPDEDMAAMERMMAAGMPGPHHAALKELDGEWKGFVRITMAPGMEPMEMPASIKREWILGGRYMKETVTSETPDGPFEGFAVVGYNNIDGVYESVWIDNMSTAILKETGAYDSNKKMFRFMGSHRNAATGMMILGGSELDLSNPDRHVMKGHQIGPDGAPFQNFYGVFERVQ